MVQLDRLLSHPRFCLLYTSLDTITAIVTRYYDQDTWKNNLVFEEESFELLQDILEDSGELKTRVPYKDLVTTTFAEKAKNF